MSEELISKIFSSDSEFALDDFEPILITPQLLKELGFSSGKVKGISSFGENDENDKNEHTYYWDMPVKQCWDVDSFTFSLVKWGKKQDYVTFSYQNLRRRLRYLHDLQNLFFAITGKELNYQP